MYQWDWFGLIQSHCREDCMSYHNRTWLIFVQLGPDEQKQISPIQDHALTKDFASYNVKSSQNQN